MRRERGLELIFLTCIDVGGGFNSFVAFDPAARELLSGALGIRFEGAVAERPGIMMRKEIVPLLSG